MQWSLNDGSCWGNFQLTNILPNDSRRPTPTDIRKKEALTKRQSVVGTRRTSDSSSKLTSSSDGKLWHIYIGMLSKETTDKDVKGYLAENNIIVSEVRKLKALHDWQEKSSAFHVSIDKSCKDSIMDEKLWPTKIEVRDWYFKPKE